MIRLFLAPNNWQSKVLSINLSERKIKLNSRVSLIWSLVQLEEALPGAEEWISALQYPSDLHLL